MSRRPQDGGLREGSLGHNLFTKCLGVGWGPFLSCSIGSAQGQREESCVIEAHFCKFDHSAPTLVCREQNVYRVDDSIGQCLRESAGIILVK